MAVGPETPTVALNPKSPSRAGRARRSRGPSPALFRWLWWSVLVLSLLPTGFLLAQALGFFGGLGTHPIEKGLSDTGTNAMVALLVALAVTPVRQITGQAWITRLRRLLGLIAFALVSLHFLFWIAVDLFFDWWLILEDLLLRPFVMAGFASWVILLLLASTSTRAAMSAMGRYWTRLHRFVYFAAILAVLHVFWLTRADYREVTVYALILSLLLGMRVAWWFWPRWKGILDERRNRILRKNNA